MFRIDDLADKISCLNLKDMLDYGITENDYKVDLTKYDEHEFKEQIGVRLNTEICAAADCIMQETGYSSNYFYKIATKHGAILMMKDENIKNLIDIYTVLSTLFKCANLIYRDSQLRKSIYECLEKIDINDVSMGGRKKSIYPLPKWRLVLDRLTYKLYCTKSCVYRIAIAYSIDTYIELETKKYIDTYLHTTAIKRMKILSDLANLIRSNTNYPEIYEKYIAPLKIDDKIKNIFYSVL